MMTVREAQNALAALGMRLTCANGEYRVTFTVASIMDEPDTRVTSRHHAVEIAERRAYYSDDLTDALATALHMYSSVHGMEGLVTHRA